MKPGAAWPFAVVAVLALTVVANGVLLYEASDRAAVGVEPDYYRRAVEWDSTLAQRARDEALGWRLEATLSPDSGGARVGIELDDRQGQPVNGATVSVTGIHNLEPNHPVAAVASGFGNGRYQALLPLRHAGLWELRFEATRGATRFTATLRRDLERSTGPAARAPAPAEDRISPPTSRIGLR